MTLMKMQPEEAMTLFECTYERWGKYHFLLVMAKLKSLRELKVVRVKYWPLFFDLTLVLKKFLILKIA